MQYPHFTEVAGADELTHQLNLAKGIVLAMAVGCLLSGCSAANRSSIRDEIVALREEVAKLRQDVARQPALLREHTRLLARRDHLRKMLEKKR